VHLFRRTAAVGATALAAAVAAVTAVTAAATPATAHEAWFVEHPDRYPLDPSALLSPLTVAGVLAAVVVAVLWRAAAARLPRPELVVLRPLERLVPWVPRLLGVHLGISLLALSLSGAVLDPSVQAPAGGAGVAVLLPQVAVGALLVLGIAVRPAALAVVAAGPVLVLLHGPRSLLLCAVLVGIAVFLAVVPPQRARGGAAELCPSCLGPAVLALRIGAAVSLVSLAVVEKLANPAMGVAMLEQQPVLNLLAPLGVSATQFVVLAGCVELLFGLLVLSGAAPQVVGLVAAVPFTASLALFGTTELVGHLPVYGVLLAFVVLGSSPASADAVRRLPRLRLSGVPVGAPPAVPAHAS
jgi:hypothetical protein